MSVYNDMANDAGYEYGSEQNEQMACNIQQERINQDQEEADQDYQYEEYMRSQEILYRKFK
jgi:hypothetical protein